MNRGTTHRYMATLVALGFLCRDERHKYSLSLGVTGLGLEVLNGMALRDHAHADLRLLCEPTVFSAALATLDGLDVLYVDVVRGLRDRSGGRGGVGLREGLRVPAYCTAMGKVLLAARRPEGALDGLLSGVEFEKCGPNTIISRMALLAEVGRVRDEGFAVEDQEREEGIIALAVPLRDESGEIVAAVDLSVSASKFALGALVDRLKPHLLATADRISARLGYRGAGYEVALLPMLTDHPGLG